MNKRLLITTLLIALVAIGQAGYAQNITRPNISGPGGLQVNSYTGSLFYQRSDLQIPGIGLSVNISFAYNSADRAKDEGFGYGWTFQYNLSYASDSTGLSVRRGDGRRDRYTKSFVAYLAPKGIFDRLLQYEPGKYKLVTEDNTEYFFDDASHKKVTSIRDRNGNTMTFAYADGRLVTITDASGRKISLTWNGTHVSEIRSDAGSPAKVITYQYNSAGCLTSVKNAGGYTTSYTYGANRVMSAMTDWNGNTFNILYNSNKAVSQLISCMSEKNISYNASQRKTYLVEKNGDKNLITTYEFDGEGRLINKEGNCCGYKNSYGYDANNNINRIIDANGNTTLYTYDGQGNVLTETDAQGKITRYTWSNMLNQVTSVTDKSGRRTVMAYDDRGNLTSVTDALNNIIRYTYDNRGNLLSRKDARNNVTGYGRNQNGYITTITDAAGGITLLNHNDWGDMLSVTDPNNHITRYAYDALGRLLTVTNPIGGTVQHAYDGNGNQIAITDQNGNKNYFTYDAHNNLLSITNALGYVTSRSYDAMNNLTGLTDANGRLTAYTYDHLNRLTKEANGAGESKQYTYDGNGNRISVLYPNGNLLYIQYDALNRVISMNDHLGLLMSYTYDANGNRLTEVNGKGSTSTYKYDALNRLISSTDALGNTAYYVYDASGNLVKETDRNGNSNSYTYDVLSRMLTNTDALGNTTVRAYDPAGNLLTQTDAKNNTTNYKYDALDRDIEDAYADNTKKMYVYDNVGNLVRYTDNKGQITNYTYDKLNRLILRVYPNTSDSLSYNATGHLLSASNQNARVFFTYDAADRVSSETLNGNITGYIYNVATGTKKIVYPGGRIIERVSDKRNQLAGIKDEAGLLVAGFTHDGAGQIISRQYANKTNSNIVYNSNGQVTDLHYSPSRFVDMGYTYDKEDNPMAVDFRHRSSRSEQYVYDKQNQIIQFGKGGEQSMFNYDAVGNRTTAQINGQAINYTVNSMNGYNAINSDKPVNVLYDGNGNVTTDGSHFYNYDTENRLLSVDNGITASYKYDALGRRIQKVTGADTINYFFDGMQVLEEHDNKNMLNATYVWGTWLDDIVSMQRNGQMYYYHTNTLGSVVAVTDAGGSVVERYEYDAFGKVTIYNKGYIVLPSSAIGNTYTFTGRQYEPETQLYYYRARHYDPVLGRFLQRDPLGYIDGMGLYTYAKNIPTGLIDPLGTEGTCPQSCPKDKKPSLPKYSTMDANFPKTPAGGELPADDVAKLVGGNVETMFTTNGYQNACALRLSYALNRSGVDIPYIKGETFKGADGKYYFLSAAKLNDWLIKTYGPPDISIRRGNFSSQMQGNKGIYTMSPNYPGMFGASGHATLFDGKSCIANHCYANPLQPGGLNQVNIWELE